MSTAHLFDGVRFAVGDAALLERACTTPAFPAFSSEVVSFLDDLSKRLRSAPECRAFPDLAAFAFWCRGAAVAAMGREYSDELLIGRGAALHITPGNVPLNFAYSLAVGLLAGNANVVRLPSADFPQSDFLCDVLSKLLADFPFLGPYAVCFRCEHDSPALSALSSLCAVRVIWGGDETIAQLRKLPKPPRSVELTFADRYSVCVVDSDAWLSAPDKETLARRFFMDAYWSDQLACTSPRAVLWLGSEARGARLDFWQRVSSLARAEYPMPEIMPVKKREAALVLATKCSEARLCGDDNYAVRVEVPVLHPRCLEISVGSGFFIECCADSLDALLPVTGEKCQTVTAYGVDGGEFKSLVKESGPRGIDRVVPFGRSMEFALRWDGYDLIRSMSRCVEIAPDLTEGDFGE